MPREAAGAASAPSPSAIDLYWLPLGAGAHSVRLTAIPLPPRGRAPGWRAGIVVARRQAT